MNMLYEGLKEKGALMLIPSSAVESMGMGGLLGAAALRQERLVRAARTARRSKTTEKRRERFAMIVAPPDRANLRLLFRIAVLGVGAGHRGLGAVLQLDARPAVVAYPAHEPGRSSRPPSASHWIDALRGFALVGIIVANLESSMLRFLLPGKGHDLGPLASLNVPFEFFESALIQGKFYSIFSFLFGLGFSVQMMRGAETGRQVRRLLPPPAGGAAAHRRRARLHLAR